MASFPAVSIDAREAARLLGIEIRTIRSYTRSRHVPFYRIGPRRIVFDRDELIAWRAARRVAPLDEVANA
jgi:excisionase family DNA binding protein